MMGYGENMVEGLSIGIEDNEDVAVDAMKNLNSRLKVEGLDHSRKRQNKPTSTYKVILKDD